MMAIKITREELDEYARLETERKALDRQSRTIATRCKQIEQSVKEQLEADGKQTAKRFGYQLALTEGRAPVAWKGAFIREVGQEKASELQEAAEPSVKVTITAPMEETDE
jgi:hypothetical protein